MSKYIPNLYDTQSKVQFFYNEFKLRDANPLGFDNKMKNWFASINKYCEDEDRFLISVNELRNEFEYFSVKPHLNCLKLVLTNMIKEHKLMPIEEFEKQFINSNDSGSWLYWSVDSVKKTFSWLSAGVKAKSNYQETVDERLNDELKLININVFDTIARKVLNYVKENGLFGQILKLSDLEDDLCKKLNLDKKQLELIIRFLEGKGNCKRVNANNRLIKFEESNAAITDKELSLMRLDDAKAMIEADIDKLEEDLEKCREEAKEALRQNNKSKCMNILKRKVRLSQQIERKHNQHTNIETLEDELLDSDTNKQILEVLANSSKILKTKQGKPEDVDDLLISIEEAMESQKNFINDISKPLGPQFEEDALEKELNLLIEEEEVEKVHSTAGVSDDGQTDYRLKDKTKNHDPIASTAFSNSQNESDDLYERLRKLKAPPTFENSKKKDKVRYTLLDDDL